MDVTSYWKQKNDARVNLQQHWDDLRKYVYAIDTRFTTSESSPWKNKSTRNKLARIRDILVTFYIRNLIPTEDFFRWRRDTNAGSEFPKEMIQRLEEYQRYKNRHKSVQFRQTIADILSDWVTFGNVFTTAEFFQKFRHTLDGQEELVFQGARPRRIMPTNAAFDTDALTYEDTAIVHRTVVDRATFFANLKPYYDAEVVEKVRDFYTMGSELQDWIKKQHQSQDGSNWLEHFDQKTVEFIEYYGDVYDEKNKQFYSNQHVIVVNKMFLLTFRPNTTMDGSKPIFYSGWRSRPDNLWHQGPLDNILGLQYRIDHIENMKADVTDFMSMPVIVTIGQGIQERLKWEPGDQWNLPPGSTIELLYPDPKIPLLNDEILTYERAMEELAGVPRETAGFRTPGEKTAFEVDQLMSNADGLFEEQLMNFESSILEPLLNLMLEINLQTLTATDLQVIFPEELLTDPEGTVNIFKKALAEGRLYVTGSKHYKARQQKVREIQNILAIAGQSDAAAQHISQFRALKAIETEVGIEEEGIISFGAQLEEQAGMQMKQAELKEQMAQIQKQQQTQQGQQQLG